MSPTEKDQAAIDKQRGNWTGTKSNMRISGHKGDPSAGITADSNLQTRPNITLSATDARKTLGDMGITDLEDQKKILASVVDSDTASTKHSYDRSQLVTAANLMAKLSGQSADETGDEGNGEDD